MSDHEHNHGPITSNVTLAKKPESEVELRGEITIEAVAAERPRALRRIAQHLDVPGFRKGNVPLPMVEDLVGEMKVLEECVGGLLSHAYGHLVKEHDLAVVGRPNITVTKLAPGNPVEFSITVAVMPVFTLPDYRTIATQACEGKELPKDVVVTDVDVSGDIEKLFTAIKERAGESGVSWELNDAFARDVLGVPDLTKVHELTRDRLRIERQDRARSTRRVAIADALLSHTSFEVPRQFVAAELEQLVGDIQTRVTRAGHTFDAYLANLGKTEEVLRAELRPDAEKRARLDIILNAIARKESLVPDEAQLARDVAHVLEHYPDADQENVHAFVRSRLTNDLVFSFLDTAQRNAEDVVETHKA